MIMWPVVSNCELSQVIQRPQIRDALINDGKIPNSCCCFSLNLVFYVFVTLIWSSVTVCWTGYNRINSFHLKLFGFVFI